MLEENVTPFIDWKSLLPGCGNYNQFVIKSCQIG